MAASIVYRLVIEPCSSFVTELQSDTIMGHLAWMAAYRNPDILSELIAKDKDPPFFIVSSGFPHDHLPIPNLKPLTYEEKKQMADRFFSGNGQEGKFAMLASCLKEVIKKEQYLPIESWKKLRSDLSSLQLVEHLLQKYLSNGACQGVKTKGPQNRVVMRTAINRLTGMAAEGILYDHEELYFAPGCKIDIWFRFFEEDMVPYVKAWVDDLSISGFGANASSGAGQFIVKSFEKADGMLPEATGSNAFMSLSNFSPAADDPIDGWYRYIIKRGKLGGTFASASPNGSHQANVWKYPIVMFTPGSVFKLTEGNIKDYYGRLIENIHYLYDSVVHFAYAFPLHIKLKK